MFAVIFNIFLIYVGSSGDQWINPGSIPKPVER